MNYHQPNGTSMHSNAFDGAVKKEPFDWSQSYSPTAAFIKCEQQGPYVQFSDTVVKQESPQVLTASSSRLQELPQVWSAHNGQIASAEYTPPDYKVACSSNGWSDGHQNYGTVCGSMSWNDSAQQHFTLWNGSNGSWNQVASDGTMFRKEHMWCSSQNYQNFGALSSPWRGYSSDSSSFNGRNGLVPNYHPPPPSLVPAPHTFRTNVNLASSNNVTVLSETSPYFASQQRSIPPHVPSTPPLTDTGCTANTSALRKRKRSKESSSEYNECITDMAQVRKKTNRFEGLTEDEVMLKTLPDHLTFGLDIVIIGINPGLTAAHIGHHYAGPGNHFWKCLHLSGLISEPLNAYHDASLMSQGIGFTNMVGRTTKSSAALSRKEMRDGAESLKEKIVKYQPRIAVFNGKGIYEIFSSSKNFIIGKQPQVFPGTLSTLVFVMPSSSARCSQLPRAIDKVPFYVALKKLRDYVRGELAYVDDSEVTFPDLDLKIEAKDEQLVYS